MSDVDPNELAVGDRVRLTLGLTVEGTVARQWESEDGTNYLTLIQDGRGEGVYRVNDIARARRIPGRTRTGERGAGDPATRHRPGAESNTPAPR